MFLKNRNIIFEMIISKVTDYAALNKAKVIFKGACLNPFYFPKLNGPLSFLQKYLFLLLSFQFCIIYGICSKKCTGNF